MAKDLGNKTEVSWPRRVLGGYVRDWSHDFDSVGGLGAVRTKNGIVLVETPTGRLRLTATVYSTDNRPFHSISVQRWDGSNTPKEYFSLSARECSRLLEFIQRIKITTLDTVSNFIITDKPNDTVILPDEIDIAKLEAAAKLSPERGEALAKLVEGTSLRDLKAVAYRRAQLEHFKRLLEDKEFREQERERCGGPESLWQDFFERNPWIFGYGLSYIPLAKLDGQTLETYIVGRGIATPGKEADALMKSSALISGMNVVEIKHYDSELLTKDSKRSGVYHPAAALSEAVAQVQVTIQIAVEEFQQSLR